MGFNPILKNIALEFVNLWNGIDIEDKQDNSIVPELFIALWENEYGMDMYESVVDELYYNYSEQKRIPYNDCLTYWLNLQEIWIYETELEGNINV